MFRLKTILIILLASISINLVLINKNITNYIFITLG